ncbi:hypothetical protein [Streptomyces rishiriensis]|uniref:hypothetical protein n=1 Tax=Streptomyces rishiriensis TaxID=68264 RepID=UPI0037D63B89
MSESSAAWMARWATMRDGSMRPVLRQYERSSPWGSAAATPRCLAVGREHPCGGGRAPRETLLVIDDTGPNVT